MRIPGIPDSLVAISVTNEKISSWARFSEYPIRPNDRGVIHFTIAYKDSLDVSYLNHVSEIELVIK